MYVDGEATAAHQDNTGEAKMATITNTTEQAPAPDTRKGSVVNATYKARYHDRAEHARKPKGVSKKAASRSCCDWLAMTLAKHVLDAKAKLMVDAFDALLSANGVDTGRWNRTTPGWQGRLRMSGRQALAKAIVEAGGVLHLADGTDEKAPKAWVEKNTR